MLHTIEKIMQEQGKQNLESNSITQSFLNESFERSQSLEVMP
jgi:hypothetical protein